MLKKSLKNQSIERRLSPRNRLKAMVKVVKEEDHTSEETINYSLTGLFFKCNFSDQYSINEKVEVSFKDQRGTAQTHTGQVVRKSREGIAIHYHESQDEL